MVSFYFFFDDMDKSPKHKREDYEAKD